MLSASGAVAGRVPFYYGWVIAVVAGMVSFAGTAESPAMLSVFFTNMEDELGWSRETMSGAVLAGTVLLLLVGPVSGRLTDKYGPRATVSVGVAITAGCIFGMSFVHSVAVFYALVATAYAMNAGIARVAVNAVVARWFVRRRGRAMAVVSMFLGLGFAIMPLMAALVSESMGWRMGWRALGASILIMALPASFLLLRSIPADVGQRVDGERDDGGAQSAGGWARSAASEAQWSARDALRTPTFWVILLSMSTIAVAILGFAVHLVPHLQSRGISLTWAAAAFTVAGVTMLPASPAWGVFLDRFSSRAAFGAAASVVIAFTAFTLAVRDEWMVVFIGITMGVGFGGFGMVQRVIFANYFGRESAGTVLGIAVPFMSLAQGIGVYFAAAALRWFGDYVAVFSLFAGLVAVSMAVMFLVPAPKRRAASAPAGATRP